MTASNRSTLLYLLGCAVGYGTTHGGAWLFSSRAIGILLGVAVAVAWLAFNYWRARER